MAISWSIFVYIALISIATKRALSGSVEVLEFKNDVCGISDICGLRFCNRR